MMSNEGATNEPIFVLDEKSVSTSRKAHVQRLNDILHLSLERGDLPRACRAWALLARCKEFDWRTKWRTSLLVLPNTSAWSQPQQLNGPGRGIELLKKLMRFYPEEQESILQEIILNLANLGKFEEALDELDLYLPSFPYQENPILHTYAGLMTLKLANSPPSEDNAQFTPNINLLRDAQKHLTRALYIDASNIVAEAFMKEATTQLAKANAAISQLSDGVPSDEEMDVDHRDPMMRSKRARKTSNKG